MHTLSHAIVQQQITDMTSLPRMTCVFLYDDPGDHANMKGRHKNYDGAQTCEMVCTEIAIEKGITPTTLHCFGLSIVDVSSKSYVWLSPRQRLDHVGMCVKKGEIHFRMRFIPDKSKLDKLLQLDEACFHYLVAQVTWDFLMDCLPNFVSRDKEEEARGVSCLLMLYKLRQDTETRNKTEDNVNKLFENFNSFLPSSLQKSIFNLMGKVYQKYNMKGKLGEQITKYPVRMFSSTWIMRWFLKSFLSANQDSYQESFVGYSVEIEEEGGFESIDDEPPPASESEKLHITIKMGQLNPTLIVVTENNKQYFSTRLLDLIRLDVSERPVADKSWWWVQIHRQDGHPKDIYFDDQMVANSFLTCLECYCRCVYDFYTSLCTDVKPSNLQGMDEIKAHGPVSVEFIKQVLVKRDSRDIYTLRTNPNSYGHYDVFYLSNRDELKSTILEKIVQQDGGYIVEGSTDSAVNIRDLMNRLVQSNSVLPDSVKFHARRIKPTSEGCDVLLDILFEQFQSNKDEEDAAMIQERKRQENQPKVYMETDVHKLSSIGSGYFTETCCGMLLDVPIVIKQLRVDIIPDVDFRTVHQEFQEGFAKLMTLFNPKFFVTYHGVSLSTTPSMLIGGSLGNHGSLCHFMQYRKPSPMLSLHHLMEVCVQLASALEHMVNINCFHGNLHCGNLAVMRFDERYLIVKITDPGLFSLYDKLPVTHEINRARLPWLAPELHSDLSAVNMQTEVYAYSTTLWQMFSNGQSPLHHDPNIVSLNPDQIQGFFAQGVDILSCPDILHVRTEDRDQIRDLKVQLYKLMKSCWTLDPEERMEPRNILRELNCNMASFGEIYLKHEISYITNTSNTSARERRNSSGFHDTRHISVPDISVLRVERTAVVPGQSLPRPTSNMSTPPSLPGRQLPGTNMSTTLQSQDACHQSMVADVESGIHLTKSVANGSDIRTHLSHSTRRSDRNMELTSTSTTNYSASSSSRTSNIVIDRKHLDFKDTEILGRGAFGKVYKGTYNEQIVAIKECTRDEEYTRFEREFMLLFKLRNKSQNIVHFIGICPIDITGNEQYSKHWYVMEYLPAGCLLQYLVKNGNILTLRQRLHFLIDIAKGMDCLFSNGIIHCDLTASNILLDNIGSKLVAKIGDFGWAKELENDEENCTYKRTNPQVQLLWAPPESFREFYNKFSDIWSYGVVCIEVFKDGDTPALDIPLPNGDQYNPKFYQAILNGSRYPRPKHCPDDVYHNVLLKCWNNKPQERIVYCDILDTLTRKVEECQT